MLERFMSVVRIVAGVAFVTVGIFLLVVGRETLLAVALILFFSATTAIEVADRVEWAYASFIIPVACVLAGLGCAGLAVLFFSDPTGFEGSRYPPVVVAIVTIVGAVFFGGGGIVALVRMARSRRPS